MSARSAAVEDGSSDGEASCGLGAVDNPLGQLTSREDLGLDEFNELQHFPVDREATRTYVVTIVLRDHVQQHSTVCGKNFATLSKNGS